LIEVEGIASIVNGMLNIIALYLIRRIMKQLSRYDDENRENGGNSY